MRRAEEATAICVCRREGVKGGSGSAVEQRHETTERLFVCVFVCVCVCVRLCVCVCV
jgi:hypothetical protein